MYKFRRCAILIIHGYAGGTYDEENLANYLELNKYYDVFQFTLPGHERNLSKVSYKKWIKSSEDKLNFLINNGYKKIYLIGHSMGGVIATYLASKYSDVKKLILAAPAFQYFTINDNKLNIKESIKLTPKVLKTYGSNEIFSRFLKLNPSGLKEFNLLVREYNKYPKDVFIPTLIIQGNNDDIVPITSSKYVYDNLGSYYKKIVYVNNLTHDVFRSTKDDEIFKLVSDFLNKNDKGEYII